MATKGHIYRETWHSGQRCHCCNLTDADLAARRPVYAVDPLNPTDEELTAAIQRSLELGTLIDADDWMARHADELGR